MFTGLITERGVVTDIARSETAAIFTVRAPHSVAGMPGGVRSHEVSGLWKPAVLCVRRLRFERGL